MGNVSSVDNSIVVAGYGNPRVQKRSVVVCVYAQLCIEEGSMPYMSSTESNPFASLSKELKRDSKWACVTNISVKWIRKTVDVAMDIVLSDLFDSTATSTPEAAEATQNHVDGSGTLTIPLNADVCVGDQICTGEHSSVYKPLMDERQLSRWLGLRGAFREPRSAEREYEVVDANHPLLHAVLEINNELEVLTAVNKRNPDLRYYKIKREHATRARKMMNEGVYPFICRTTFEKTRMTVTLMEADREDLHQRCKALLMTTENVRPSVTLLLQVDMLVVHPSPPKLGSMPNNSNNSSSK